MIGLRDRYTSRRRGEWWLLVGDALAAGTAIPFIVGAYGVETEGGSAWSVVDVALITVWAILPRVLRRVIDPVLKRPRTFSRNLTIAASIGASLVLLVGIGLALIEGTATEGVGDLAHSWWLLMILGSWGCGFFLFLPRVYLLNDLFLSGLVALGVAVGRPGVAVVLPLFFLGLALSGAMRHQLHDVFAEIGRPRVNIVNPRRLALAIAAVVSIAFIATRAGSEGLFAILEIEERVVEHPRWIDTSGRRGEAGRSREESLGTEEVFGAPPPNEGEGIVAGSLPNEPRERGQIGFTRQVQLGNLTRTQADPRVVLVAREGDAQGRRKRTPSLRGDALWRGLTLCTFDAFSEAWVEERLIPRELAWPGNPIGHVREEWIDGPTVLLDIAVVTPTMPTLPAPYFPTWLLEPRGATDGYRRNEAGDIFPLDGVAPRTRYATYLIPRPFGAPSWPLEPIDGLHGSPRYDAFPTADEIGFDLEGYARSIFGEARTIQEKVRALELHFRSEYAYDRDAGWSALEGHLARFCLETRVGNCEYFATAAALLLRAGGVSTRVVAGFLGWEWDRVEAQYVVRNGAAHLWTELYFPGHGWFPLDPTAWVPVRDPADRTSNGGAQNPAMAGAGGAAEDLSDAAGERSGERSPTGGAMGGRDDAAGLTPDASNRPAGAPPEGLFADEPGGADPGEESSEDLISWVETIPPPPPPNVDDGATASPDGELDSDTEPDALARRPGETEIEHQRRVADARKREIARAILALIAGSLLAFVLLQTLRPARAAEQKEVDEGEGGEEDRGIPDPLAGWAPLPADFEPSTPDERVIVAYHRLQGALAERRRHRRPEETPVEHGDRQTQRVAPERGTTVEEDFRKLCGVVYAALYAHGTVTEEQARRAEEVCRRLRGELR